MSFRMDLWEVEGTALKQVSAQALDFEERLEDWLAHDPSLSGMDVLIIGRQVRTDHGGRIDLLGMDRQGNTIVFELKKGRTPRDVVAQVLDYASWVKELSYSEIDRITQDHLQKDLPLAFAECFGDTIPETVNSEHTLVVVAPELDESSERIVEYLADEAKIAINVVFFNSFRLDDKELLGRAWFRDPIEVEGKKESRQRSPWSGYWFVNVGEGETRNWDDFRKYGYLSAWQGEQPLKKLRIGDKLFAYMKGLGYVGYGEVFSETQMIRDFEVDGEPLLEWPLAAQDPQRNVDDPKRSEWVVGVKWERTYEREQAKTFRGVFANQNIVCKLRHPETVSFLENEFAVAGTVSGT